MYSCSNWLDKARPESGGTHIFFLSNTVFDQLYTQFLPWGAELHEHREARNSRNRAGYHFARCSVEARSIWGTEGKNVVLKFNLSLNDTYCNCIYMI